MDPDSVEDAPETVGNDFNASFSPDRGLEGDSTIREQSDPEEDSAEHPEDTFLRMGRARATKKKKRKLPRKDSMILARKKGNDHWYLYKFLGKGTKDTAKNIGNPWMNV